MQFIAYPSKKAVLILGVKLFCSLDENIFNDVKGGQANPNVCKNNPSSMKCSTSMLE